MRQPFLQFILPHPKIGDQPLSTKYTSGFMRPDKKYDQTQSKYQKNSPETPEGAIIKLNELISLHRYLYLLIRKPFR